jgi:hypothetical protein
MPNYAVICPAGHVRNIIVWDGVSEWKPPEGCSLLEVTDNGDFSEGLEIGDVLDPAPPPEEP